jgi:hypothetical protein
MDTADALPELFSLRQLATAAQYFRMATFLSGSDAEIALSLKLSSLAILPYVVRV